VTTGLPASWLRYNCPCPDCRDPVTGQRLVTITDIPNGLVVTLTARTATGIEVTFAPDGHRAAFGHDWPAARCGFAPLRGVPAADGMVLEVAATFGYVRETNYGRLFDVRVGPDPANLAFTSRAIAPHTDNPYRDPVPRLHLLHCLRDARSGGGAAGGDTGLVDGFAVAATLRAVDPQAFGVLTGTPVPFGYIDKETELTARQPVISLSPRGWIAGIRYNERSMRPPAEEAFFPALRAWAELLARPEFTLRQGCYADLDGLLSTLAVLSRPQ
jgi:gamma-butyrobetaine dioxygenase